MSKGRVCLAYSGGLDTSTILKWLINEGYTVVCFLADVGQEEDWAAVEKKALSLGAERMIIDNLQEEFVEKVIHRAIQCNAIYEDRYLLGTSLARPIIAKAQVKAAIENNCDFVSHGCTGKGNDQVRFELAFAALRPSLKVIAPWRLPEFCAKFQSVSRHQIPKPWTQGRADLLRYAAENNIPVSSTPKEPWSKDAGILEDPDHTPPKELWTRTVDPLDAPNEPTDFSIHFEAGIPVKVILAGQETTGSVAVFKLLNKIGHDNGVGRIDIVENRFSQHYLELKYKDTIARLAHLDLEGLVLDGRVRELRDQFVTHSWSRLLYNGLYFSPEREFLDNSIVFSSKNTTGVVRLRAYKGNVSNDHDQAITASNLYSEEAASMDSLEGFSPQDTTGFIAIQAIRLKKYGEQRDKEGNPLTQS
ncbi:hypothetical protein Daesc_004560 [Daldinia eschscholtzii]|uniref:argininosuccinate synthase n=1 Tax=Daldinia eschscholtzii TaxID=292717 RepID=A0AAX6MQ82_9PEZI